MERKNAEEDGVYDCTEKGDVFCAGCGGSDKFYVTHKNYETHITCVSCGDRILIHEG